MTRLHEEILRLLRAGSVIRWVPKSVIYNKVIGVDYRFLCVDGHVKECGEWTLALGDLRQWGYVRYRTRNNITYAVLKEG